MADHASSKRKPEEDSASAEAADQETADAEDDPAIRTLNEMSRMNLKTPEWIEENKRLHYQHQALLDSIYDALQNGEIESDSDDDNDGAAAAERSKQLWEGVDLSGLNKGDGEYAIAVYPAGVYPPEEQDHDVGAAAAGIVEL